MVVIGKTERLVNVERLAEAVAGRFSNGVIQSLLIGVMVLGLVGTALGQEKKFAEKSTEIAGVSLQDLEVQLTSENAVIRRRAGLMLQQFGSEAEALVAKALRHEDASVVFWACEAVGRMDNASEALVGQVERILDDATASEGLRLAAAYASYCQRTNLAALDFLLDRLDRDFDNNQSKSAVSIAYPMTAADYLAQIGPKRLGSNRERVIAKLKSTAAAVDKAIQEKTTGGISYHVGKATRRAAILLQDPAAETRFGQRLQAGPSASPELREGEKSEASDDTGMAKVLESGQAEFPDVSGKNRKVPTWPGLVNRPNILWISCEDISPNLGCYGDRYASTPTLDQLATQGIRFDRAFTHAGVCAVLRSGIITGRYPVSIGTQHMRTFLPELKQTRCFPELLREAGYFCTNRSKTDYQMQHSDSTWDREGNRHQDWRDRPEGKPFFSVINLTISHESQVRHGEKRHAAVLKKLKLAQHHDPEAAAEFLPPYFPNTKESRQDWAWYQDNISEMDRQVGEILDQLDKDGLADSTVVVFWSDHGQGLPRGKRWLFDSGTHVPLIVRFPDRFAAGQVREDLVTLLDLGPTMLSLAGVEVPKEYDGRVFLGQESGPEPEQLFFHRDRMDEAFEIIRSVRNRRFRYLRNFQRQRTYAQLLEYMDLMPTMQVWRKMHQAGELDAIQDAWFASNKPAEELYDVVADRHQIHNLAELPQYQQTLEKMRKAMEALQVQEGDLGMMPEVLMMEQFASDYGL